MNSRFEIATLPPAKAAAIPISDNSLTFFVIFPNPPILRKEFPIYKSFFCLRSSQFLKARYMSLHGMILTLLKTKSIYEQL